jgi:hypothetical protein
MKSATWVSEGTAANPSEFGPDAISASNNGLVRQRETTTSAQSPVQKPRQEGVTHVDQSLILTDVAYNSLMQAVSDGGEPIDQ